MQPDPIVEEVRKIRDEYAKRFNYDLEFAEISREAEAGQKESDFFAAQTPEKKKANCDEERKR